MLCLAATADSAEVPYRELRALWDISGFRFEELSQGNPPWLLLKATPSADSGLTSGLYISAETGQLVREPGKPVEVVTKGTVKQIARFDGRGLSTDPVSYSWGMPTMSRSKDIRRSLFSPFVSGGTFLSHSWDGAIRETQFDPYYLVPEEWNGMLSTYLELRRVQGEGWLKAANRDDRQRINQLLAADNPIVALHAFRALRAGDAAGGRVPAKPAELIANASLGNRALLITDLLRALQRAPVTEADWKSLVPTATYLAQLRPIAVAARAIVDFGDGPPDAASKQISRELINQCAAAMKGLSGDEKLREELQKLTRL